MICETCKSEGKTSHVYDRGISTTLLNCTPFYDEKGAYHHHDSNTTTSTPALLHTLLQCLSFLTPDAPEDEIINIEGLDDDDDEEIA